MGTKTIARIRRTTDTSGHRLTRIIPLVIISLAVLSSAATAQTLPSGWTSADIGDPLVAGSASFSGGVFSVAAGRAYAVTAADRLTFVYVALTGDMVLTARVPSIAAASTGAEAGVMIRESLASGAKHASVVLTGASTVAMKSRAVTGGSRTVASESAAAAPVWLRLQRTASTFAAFRSVDGVAWTPIGTVTVAMTATVYAGLAVADGLVSLPIGSTSAQFDSVDVSQPNQPPSVSLTGPANGATYPAPGNITLTASASDTDGTIAAVDFYAGTTLIGSATTAPYSATWSNVVAGNYSLKAVARDDDGASASSSVRNVTVTAVNEAPAVSLTAPASASNFAAPATITVSASASDADGTVSVVEFYSGTTLIGSDTTSPYSVVWNNVPAGSYDLTAVARDDGNAMTVSGARTITVSDAQTATTAIFNASINDAAVDYYLLEVFPDGADPASANAIAARNIGKPPVVNGECQVDVRDVIEGLSPGSYIATVTAFNSVGSARSAPSPAFTR